MSEILEEAMEENKDMTMQEITRIIVGLRAAGWDEKKINDFMIYIESGNEEYMPGKDNGTKE